MPKSLLIVESPNKTETLSKYFGRNDQALASVGHLKGVSKSKLGIDLEHYLGFCRKKNRFVRSATGFHVGPS
jgi:DNA topoisomerase IA